MKSILRHLSPLLLTLALVASAVVLATPAHAAKRYVCPPCGAPCDTIHFDHPGTCPQCGMALVEEGTSAATAAAAPDERKKVAILLFNGVEIVDYTGPYEMFGAAGCNVYTVGVSTQPVTTAMGMVVTPKYTFAEAPQPDVLVVPGGSIGSAMNSAPTIDYVKSTSGGTQHTLSVCNGAFILAKAGLLDGLSATTTVGNIDRLAAQYPKTKVVRDQRVVDNGKIVTAGGLSAGIDGALHVIGKLMGEGAAQNVALNEEYDWAATAGYRPAMLAYREIPNINVDGLGHWDVTSTKGDGAQWELAFHGTSDLSAADLNTKVGAALVDQGKWTRVDGSAAAAGGATGSAYKFTGHDGQSWSGTFQVERDGSDPHHFNAKFTVARSS